MPIFDQGYQHWDGKLSGHGARWLAIAARGVKTQWQNKAVRRFAIAACLPSLALVAFLAVWGLLEQKSGMIAPLLGLLQGLPDAMKTDPVSFRATVWTLAFDSFFKVQMFTTMVMVVLVGPDLISQDLRFNAIPLYFSRPMRRIDYFLGKLGVIAFYLSLSTVLPTLFAYVMGLCFSLDLAVLKDTWRVLLGSLGYCAIAVVSAGTLMLAISSLSRNSRLVGAAWMGLWLISGTTSRILSEEIRQDWCAAVSYTNNLTRVQEEVLGAREARERVTKLFQEGARQVGRTVMGIPIGRRDRGRTIIPPPPPPSPIEARRRFDPNDLKYPVEWAGGVLGGLFVLSAVTLSTRVKTLDRLK